MRSRFTPAGYTRPSPLSQHGSGSESNNVHLQQHFRKETEFRCRPEISHGLDPHHSVRTDFDRLQATTTIFGCTCPRVQRFQLGVLFFRTSTPLSIWFEPSQFEQGWFECWFESGRDKRLVIFPSSSSPPPPLLRSLDHVFPSDTLLLSGWITGPVSIDPICLAIYFSPLSQDTDCHEQEALQTALGGGGEFDS